MNTFFSIKKNIDSIIAAAAGFCIILLFCRHGGIGISPDAVVYSSVAENVASHGTLRDFNQQPVVDFPAFYPLLLGFVTFVTGLKPLLFAPIGNALLFGLVIFLAGFIMQHFLLPSKPYKWMILSCILFSPCLLEVYSMLWSETVFILLFLLFMLALRRYLMTHATSALILLTVIASLACITRLAGVTFIGTGMMLLLASRELPLRRKIIHSLIFGIGSSSLEIANLIRNLAVSGTLAGHREYAFRSFLENTKDTGIVFFDWLPFLSGHYRWSAIVVVVFFLFFFILWVRNTFLMGQKSSYENIAITFFLLFTSFMIVSASIWRYEQLNSRLLSPLFIPLLWGSSTELLKAIRRVQSTRRKPRIIAGLVLFGCFQFHQLNLDYETWDGVKDAGIPGYTEDDWRMSETVLFIKKNIALLNQVDTIYSNANDAVYFFIQRPALLLAHKESPKEINQFVENHKCFIVWFNEGENTDLIDLNFILKYKNLVLVKRLKDGAVYRTTN